MLLQTTWIKNLEKVKFFFKLQKHINPRKSSFQLIEYPDARKTIGKSYYAKQLV